MRIAEIAVIAPRAEARKKFITTICGRLEVEGEQLTVGRLTINDQLVLHLYGLPAPEAAQTPPAWDLLSRKLLGYVVLFAWQDEASFEHIKLCVEQITARAETALIVAAQAEAEQAPALEALRDKSVLVDQQGRFLFYQENDAHSVKQVLLALVDLLLERAE